MSLTTVLYISIAAIASIAIAFFQYYYKTSKNRRNIVLAILRFLAIFLIAFLLINPKIKTQQLEDVKPVLNVLIDNSSSIKYAKQEKKVKNSITGLKNNGNLNKKFIVNYYSFSDDLHHQDTLSFNRSETNILKTLQTLEQLTNNSIAPSILITDGNQTYGASYEFYKSNQQLYPVIVGDTLTYNDLKISQLNVNTYTNLNNKFPVEVFLQYDGNASINKTITVKKGNSVVFSKQIRFSEKQNSKKVSFYLPANKVGIQNYTCAIAPLLNEKNTINNVKNFTVEVIDEKAKILIFSETNHPDISMIKRSIETNKQHKVIVENNLSKNIQLKDYQLIILYQPTDKFAKIFKNLKNSNLNFFVITGTKTDWRFLNAAQAYFSKNSISKTEKYTAVFNSSYDEFQIKDIGFSSYPPVEDYFGDITFSASHDILLYQNINSFTTKSPLLASFIIDNNRRGAVLFGENSWKWRMLTHVENQSFEKFDTFFNKLIQYLSSAKRSSQLDITYKKFLYANSKALIDAQFFDATYAFDPTATLQLSLTNTLTNKIQKLPFALKKNSYQIVLTNLEPGDYNFKVTVNNHNILKSGKFTVSEYAVEQQFTAANTKHLKSIANASQGALYHINDTPKLITELLSDKRYTTIQKSTEKIVSLIEWKWLLGFVILILSLEWFIRKYNGLI